MSLPKPTIRFHVVNGVTKWRSGRSRGSCSSRTNEPRLRKAQSEAPVGAVPGREARDLVEVVAAAGSAGRRRHRSFEAELAGERGVLAAIVANRLAVGIR